LITCLFLAIRDSPPPGSPLPCFSLTTTAKLQDNKGMQAGFPSTKLCKDHTDGLRLDVDRANLFISLQVGYIKERIE